MPRNMSLGSSAKEIEAGADQAPLNKAGREKKFSLPVFIYLKSFLETKESGVLREDDGSNGIFFWGMSGLFRYYVEGVGSEA